MAENEGGTATIATAYVQLVPTLKGVQGAIGKEFGSSAVQKEAEDTGKGIGSKLATGAVAGLAAGAAAAGGALAGLYKIGETFDDVADTIAVATGKSGAALDGLVGQAKEIGTTIPVEFEKIGPALSTVSQKMGLAGDDLTKVTEQFLALGNLGQNIDMDQATGALNAFGVTGADVSGELDKLFKVSQLTGTGMDKILAGVQGAAPALQQLGFSLDDSAVLFGQLDKAGLNASGVLNGMGKGLVKLAKDGEQPQEAFGRITGQITDLVAQGKDAEAIDLASGLFGTKNAAAFIDATKSGAINIADLKGQLDGASGSILQAQTDTADFAEQWTLFKNKAMTALEPVGTAVFGLAGTLGGKLNDAFDVIVPAATSLFNLFKTGDFQGGIFGLEEDSPIIGGLLTFRDLIKDLVPLLGGAFKQAWDTIGPILTEVGGTIGGALVDVFKTLWPQIEKLLPILGDLFSAFNPISLIFKTLLPMLPEIADVFAGLARTVGTVLGKALEVVVPMLGKLVDGIFPPLQNLIRDLLPFVLDLVKIIGDLVAVVGDALVKAFDAVSPLLDTLITIFSELIGYVGDLVKELLPPLQSAFEDLVPMVQAVLDVIIGLASAIIEKVTPVIEALVPVVERVFKFIADTIANIVQVFHGLIDIVTGIFSGDWSKVWEGVKEVFGGIWDQIKNVLSTAWDVIVEVITGIGPKILDILGSIGGKLLEWGGDLLGLLWDGIKAAVPAVLEWFGTLPGMLWDAIVALAGWLGEKGGEFLGWLWDGITSFFTDTLLPWFGSLPGLLWDGLKALGQGEEWLAEKGVEFLGWLWNGISSFFTDTLLPWFGSLPGLLWDGLKSLGQGEAWLAEKGVEFLTWIWNGITSFVTDTLIPWFGSLPGLLWDGLKSLGQGELWLLDRGVEFLTWLWNGITSFFSDTLLPWFAALPGNVWAKIYDGLTYFTDRGAEFIGWLKDGIVKGATAIWNWFSNTDKDDPNGLLGQVWGGLKAVGDTIVGFGSQVIDWIVEGITSGIRAVADAIAGLFDDLTFNPDGTISSPDGYVTANPFAPAGARGNVVPGRDPGRRDNMLMPVRSGESIFVPEFTNAIGGARTVFAGNRAAEQGTLSQYFGPGFAKGGVVGYGKIGAENVAEKVSSKDDPWVQGLFSGAMKVVKDIWKMFFGASISGELNPSQDPSSFGWARGQGIEPYDWNGVPIVGGVAGGTQALWGALLSALVPQIPGGLLAPIWGYENRNNVNSPGNASFHSYGLAIDVNAPQNPNGAPGRGRSGQGVIPADLASSLAAKYGMLWGGDFNGTQDPMHFEIHVAPNQIQGSGIIGSIFSNIVSAVFGGGVEQWRPLAMQALTEVGAYKGMNLLGNIDAMMNQIRTESSGNPNAINTDPSDINFQRGDPSIGLLQVIGSTFRGALSGTPFEYLIPRGQRDPYASLVSSTLYSLARYGSLARAWQGVPYDQGGWLMPGLGQVPVNMLRQPEPVLTPDQWRIAEAAIDQASRNGQRTGDYTWNVYPQQGQAPADIAREMDRLLVFSGR